MFTINLNCNKHQDIDTVTLSSLSNISGVVLDMPPFYLLPQDLVMFPEEGADHGLLLQRHGHPIAQLLCGPVTETEVHQSHFLEHTTIPFSLNDLMLATVCW